MKWMERVVCISCLAAFLAVASGCETKGPAEEAGKKIDQAVEMAKDSLKEITDKLKE